MNYIYDILVNFQKELYDIYDWNTDDNIIHIRKIPVFKVKKNVILNILKNNVKVSTDFLSKIYNKTEMFLNKKIVYIDYSCVISDSNEVVVLQFKRNGNIINKSKLLIDENEEVIQCVLSLTLQNIEYKILNPLKSISFRTRREEKIYDYILQELNRAIKKEETSKLQYLYFECFGKSEKDSNKILEDIIEQLKNEWNNYHIKIYDFFKLTTSK